MYYFIRFKHGKECGVENVAGIDVGEGRIRFYSTGWSSESFENRGEVASFSGGDIVKCYWRPEKMDGDYLPMVSVEELYGFSRSE